MALTCVNRVDNSKWRKQRQSILTDYSWTGTRDAPFNKYKWQAKKRRV